MWKLGASALLCLGLLLPWGAAQAQVTIDWVAVGGPGNTADGTGFGAVPSVYRISQHEVTNAQYAAFLNAVAKDADPGFLYNLSMGAGFGGITRSPAVAPFTYTAIAGREQMPVNIVSFYDALRFANWLHNGQPTGAQDATTTEDGAYTITAPGIAANDIMRNPGATVFLPSEDEWYKAAYYDPSTDTYFDYPAGTDTQTVCAVPSATANTANCNNVVGDLTPVGNYGPSPPLPGPPGPGSPSPNGTFDQGGNVWEWNETIIGTTRGRRGGSFGSPPNNLAAPNQFSFLPVVESGDVGFRVASPPEPVPAPTRRGCGDG